MQVILVAFVATAAERSTRKLPTERITPKIKVSDITIDKSVPQVDLAPFTLNFRLISEEESDDAPRVDSLGDSLSAAVGSQFFVDNLADKLDALDVKDDTTELSIYRLNEKPYKDFRDESFIGYGALKVGTARAQYFDKKTGTSTLIIEESTAEILVGDLLLPSNTTNKKNLEDSYKPGKAVTGYIIDMIQSLYYGGSYQFVFVDIGTENDIREGAILQVRSNPSYHSQFVKIPTKRNRDREKLVPVDTIGTILIFKAYQSGSYGLITHAKSGMRAFDLVSTK